jgi:hypothetical protein
VVIQLFKQITSQFRLKSALRIVGSALVAAKGGDYVPPSAGLAQLVERVICNHEVAGSTPAAGTILAFPNGHS